MPFGAWRFKSSHPHFATGRRLRAAKPPSAGRVGSAGARSRDTAPAQRADVLGAAPGPARRRRSSRQSASMPSRGSCRTWRSTTPRRPAGACRSTCGSCGGSGSTCSSRSSTSARSSSSPGAAASPRSRPAGAGRSAATAAAAPRSTASGSISTRTSGRPGSWASTSTAKPRAGGVCRRSSSSPIRRPTRASPWPLRATDVDVHGHVNNAVYWQAVEHVLPSSGVDPGQRLVAELDYRDPIDLGDEIELVAEPAAARRPSRVGRNQGRGAGGGPIASPQAARFASR